MQTLGLPLSIQKLHTILLSLTLLFGCGLPGEDSNSETFKTSHGPIIEGIYAPMGEPIPGLSEKQLAQFERGKSIGNKRFLKSEGLGPAFNVTFCFGCHEKPAAGGGASLYRNFLLAGEMVNGEFIPSFSGGGDTEVQRQYQFKDGTIQPIITDSKVNVMAQRAALSGIGVGFISKVSREEIEKNADPDDADGDGISGRPNFSRGFIGRIGLKAQASEPVNFFRSAFKNHLGLTTNFLSEKELKSLPVDLSLETRVLRASAWFGGALTQIAQTTVPSDLNVEDKDDIPDPELSNADLVDLVAFMLNLAAPEVKTDLNEQEINGLNLFDKASCSKCHIPRMEIEEGPLPLYSDLLLHDMGEELSDGLPVNRAEPSEFRTQPLWGLAATGPYLHDGRAFTIEEAILMHGGEAKASRDMYDSFTDEEKEHLRAFLLTLGGKDDKILGIFPKGMPIPKVGEYGGPVRELTDMERIHFLSGRTIFDRDHGYSVGTGAPRFNGDICAGCHLEPTLGGAGPRGVSVIRHGIKNSEGEFTPPVVGTILHRQVYGKFNEPQDSVNVYEVRQPPHLFGLGLIENIPEENILANADPNDADADGISGRASYTDGGVFARFGWKAQIPNIHEFVRDGFSSEMGITIEYEEGRTFGTIHDTDDIPDPELPIRDVEAVTTYLQMLGPPPRQKANDEEAAAKGEDLFESVGCSSCHIPSLEGRDGPVPLYSDLLLHEILPEGATGIEEATANVREFRTSPLWGVSQTAPYMHDGVADTLQEAILRHDGEALQVKQAFEELNASDQQALLEFLGTL